MRATWITSRRRRSTSIRDAPDVAQLLVDRGAWFDIFIAVGLRDAGLVERCLRDDPEALDHRTWQGKYTTVHKGRPSTREEIGDHRGDTYRWVFGHNVSVVDAARLLGFDDMVQLLLRHASPAQRLLAACAAADRSAAEAVVSAHPDVVGTLTRDQMRLIADRAHANDTAAVTLMLDLGFDALVPGPDDFEAIRWAAFLGNAEMTRALLRHNPPINVPDRSYGGTSLDNCVYGALHGWGCEHGRLRDNGAAAPRSGSARRSGGPADRSRRSRRSSARAPRAARTGAVVLADGRHRRSGAQEIWNSWRPTIRAKIKQKAKVRS